MFMQAGRYVEPPSAQDSLYSEAPEIVATAAKHYLCVMTKESKRYALTDIHGKLNFLSLID